jgi:hypothetical protein
MFSKTIQVVFFLWVFSATSVFGENIDPYEDGSRYAYSENVGWLNFEPNAAGPDAGATVSSDKLTGFIWAENIGWINLSPENYGGVFNDGQGNLSGYAWGENVGWINFSPSYGGVTINSNGNFDGWAWGENTGWINFQSVSLYGYNVKACKVNFHDLANFVDDWLKSGPGQFADLYSDENVDFKDFSIFAEHWFDYCPDDWKLK